MSKIPSILLCSFSLLLPAVAVAGPLAATQPDGKRPIGMAAPEERLDKAFDKIEPMFKADKVAHVAHGIALRNRTSGTIHLRSVPVGSKVVRSFLFWNYSDGNREGPKSQPILLNGNLFHSRKTADNSDPCWGMAGNHSYVADVTIYTNQSGHPNQDYHVVVPFDEATSTTGQNPWSPVEWDQKVRLQGATLVIVYANESTSGPLFVYAAPADATFSGYAAFPLINPPLTATTGQLTMAGGDGQRGGGHDNFASNELTYFNGTQIAGPPVAASDWDGSDGWPLVQLWDTHTHLVSWDYDAGVSTVEYVAGGDCLTAVAFVLDID